MMTNKTEQIVSLTPHAAREIVDVALDLAAKQGLTIHATVVDAAGHVLVYQRMSGAPLPARVFSERKAVTALSFKRSTALWKERLASNPHLAAGLSQHPQVAMIGGGEPVVIDGQVVGAIGIAGASEEQDIELARAALQSLNDTA
jgi:uncharacterized protein GlcG (DUF336 family)